MSETVTLTRAELTTLQGRVNALARENAHLKLINSMLTRLSSVSGLENVIEHILSILMETIGGSNLIVYCAIEGCWRSRDIYGTVRELAALDDPLVARAVQDGCSLRSIPEVNRATGFETWIFPLVLQQRTIGVVVMEGMQLADDNIHSELQPFFTYAALMLGNEITNYSELEAVHRSLLETHLELEREIVVRSEAEGHYQMLFEQSPDGIVLFDPITIMPMQFNSSAHTQLGYTREEFAGLHIWDYSVSEDEAEVNRHAHRIDKQGWDDFETKHRTKSGEIRDVSVKVRKMTIHGREMVHTVFRDITVSKKMEEELLKSQKLESIGVLAGGIAHDFNNLLMAILGNISLAGMSLASDSPAANLLGESEKACLQARNLTQQLLTFAKGGAPLKKLTSLAELVTESATFALRGSGASCYFRIADDLWSAEIDRGQISQVIHNLVINAAQAMPTGGIIRVSCDNVTFPGDRPGLQTCLRISIKDQGIGIPADLLPRIFDPYFTTKQKGNGLGLASAYSIVKRHNGCIEVESTMGVGSTFTVYLPAASERAIPEIAAAEQLSSRVCRILVMDDEEMVLEVVTMMLTHLGHVVETVHDGDQAIRVYRQALDAGSRFDIVILDLTVSGGMGGRETVRHLHELDPTVKAVVSSGYASDSTIADFRAYGFSGVLSKPYHLHDVRKLVAELFPLDAPSGNLV